MIRFFILLMFIGDLTQAQNVILLDKENSKKYHTLKQNTRIKINYTADSAKLKGRIKEIKASSLTLKKGRKIIEVDFNQLNSINHRTIPLDFVNFLGKVSMGIGVLFSALSIAFYAENCKGFACDDLIADHILLTGVGFFTFGTALYLIPMSKFELTEWKIQVVTKNSLPGKIRELRKK